MKNLPATFALLLLPISNTQAQAPDIQWQKSFGGSGGEWATAVQQTADSGYVVTGSAGSNNGDVIGFHGSVDCWVLKLNAAGDIQWQKTLGGSLNDDANAIQQTADGGYIVAGYSNSIDGDVTGNHGDYDFWIVKLNASGDLQWQKSLGGTKYDAANAIQQTADGGYIVTGESESKNGDASSNHGYRDMWVVKLNATGDIQWQKSLGGLNHEIGRAVQVAADGGYVIAGHTSSFGGDVSGNHGGEDFWVVKLSATGDLQWQKALGGSSYEGAFDIQSTADSGSVVIGYTFSTDGQVIGNHGASDYWVVKLDAGGNIQWQKPLGGKNQDEPFSIQTTTDGGYVAAGWSGSIDGQVSGNHGDVDFWIVNLSAEGNIRWQKSLGGSKSDQANSIQPTLDGGYIVAGISNSKDGDVGLNQGGFDFWVVKLGPDSIMTSSHEPEASPAPIIAYPNPATNRLTISLQNQQTIHGYSLTDLSGREIVRVRLDTAVPKAEINIGDLPKGVHLLQVQSGNRVFCQKLVVH